MTIDTREATEAPVKTAADVLRNAVRIIEERGWCQGDYEKADGSRCVMGAIYLADDRTYFEAASPIGVAAIGMLMNHLRASVIAWNDEPGRTAAEVIDALRAAADAA